MEKFITETTFQPVDFDPFAGPANSVSGLPCAIDPDEPHVT